MRRCSSVPPRCGSTSPCDRAIGRELPVVRVEHAIDQGQIDMLALARAFAMEQRRADRAKGVHRGHMIGDRGGRIDRMAVRLAHHMQQPARRESDEIVADPRRVGTVLSVSGYGAHHDLWIDRRDIVIAEAITGEHARRVVLKEYVGSLREVLKDRRAFGPLEIDTNALLAPIMHREVCGWRALRSVVGAESKCPAALAFRGGSTLITSAPRSTNNRAATGPARYCVTSRIRMPSKIFFAISVNLPQNRSRPVRRPLSIARRDS